MVNETLSDFPAIILRFTFHTNVTQKHQNCTLTFIRVIQLKYINLIFFSWLSGDHAVSFQEQFSHGVLSSTLCAGEM